MAEFLNSITWAHTVPIMVVVLVLIFRKPLAAKIGEIKLIRGEGKKYDILFDQSRETSEQAIPGAGDSVITPDDVFEAFKRIPELKEDEIKKYLRHCHTTLIRNGVITKRQLYALVSSDEVLGPLRAMYIEELLRAKEAPLDPVAVATWGAILFTYGVKTDVLAAVRRMVRMSPEYRDKHE